MTLQLIVKGNASEARVACDYNGITVISVAAHPRYNLHIRTERTAAPADQGALQPGPA